MTPLMYAVNGNQKNMVEILIDKGANLEHRDNFGESALTKAYKFGFCDICDLLEKNGASNMVSYFRPNSVFCEQEQTLNIADGMSYLF